VCRSTPNQLTDLQASLQKCTSQDELTRTNNFTDVTVKATEDLVWLKGQIQDSLAMGESMFGTFGHATITNEVRARNRDLIAKKEQLTKDIHQKEKVIQRSERDFIDVKDTLPETQPTRSLLVVEDYTLAFLFLSYLFMIIIFVYSYTITSSTLSQGLTESLASSGVLSMILFLIFYYVC
jgi:hypothetical protein